jgi:hypothetical protein
MLIVYSTILPVLRYKLNNLISEVLFIESFGFMSARRVLNTFCTVFVTSFLGLNRIMEFSETGYMACTLP